MYHKNLTVRTSSIRPKYNNKMRTNARRGCRKPTELKASMAAARSLVSGQAAGREGGTYRAQVHRVKEARCGRALPSRPRPVPRALFSLRQLEYYHILYFSQGRAVWRSQSQ